MESTLCSAWKCGGFIMEMFKVKVKYGRATLGPHPTTQTLVD